MFSAYTTNRGTRLTEYEYRPVKRVKGADVWEQIHTNRGGGRAYLTLGGAKGVASRERRSDAHYATYYRRVDGAEREYEYAVQRRQIGEWEDFD